MWTDVFIMFMLLRQKIHKQNCNQTKKLGLHREDQWAVQETFCSQPK